MNKVLKERKKIYDHIDGSQSLCKWSEQASHTELEQYCIAKDTIQDTGEALLAHRQVGFNTDSSRRYIEYYGVLQAVYMQQDSIGALHKIFDPKQKLEFCNYPAWKELRDLRNDTAGHPVGRLKRLNRYSISYNSVNYQWLPNEDISSWESICVNLAALLDSYDIEAAGILTDIFIEMSQRCTFDHT